MDEVVHLQCEFDLTRAEEKEKDEEEYSLEDLQDLVLVRLGTWVREDSEQGLSCKFGYALMVRENTGGTYSRVGIAKTPDEEDW